MGWQQEVEAAWGVSVSGVHARGGNAEVHAARQPDLERRVALKVITAETSEVAAERFRREAKTVAQLSHPNIVPIHNFGVFDGVMVLMMPWFDESLADRIKAQPCSPHEARRVMEQMLDALAHAHASGVIHRDVKPSNIMIGADGRYVLADFGIAATADDAGLTRTGAVPGSAGYLAPELISGGRPSPQSDLYALGATLFEAVTGRPPFPADHAISAAYLHVHAPVPDVEIREDPALARAITRLLSKDPSERALPAVPATAPRGRRLRGLLAFGALALLTLGAYVMARDGTDPVAGRIVGPDTSVIRGCPSNVGKATPFTVRWSPDPAPLTDAALVVEGKTFSARVSNGSVEASIAHSSGARRGTLTYTDAGGDRHSVEVAVPTPPAWARFQAVATEDAPAIGRLQDGDTAPVFASPSELAPGPLGNASVVVAVAPAGSVVYAAAAVDRERGGDTGPVYLRVCDSTPCGQGAESEAHVLDPVRRGWFAGAGSFGEAAVLRFVWSSGTAGDDASLSEACALVVPAR